ncbi:hypothetical protein [Rhodococcus sp. WAY2]|uniref:hypothetical protein n=1 Tax=Rhodococcus sp. WAY2 TaxID=2663121 RepID=UPI00131F8518|nr:hypothetical protein [Rhodococcus sp. WAY2]QHE72664.1 hypothetical protein GFS60_06309 [Rhodococcus sp. WAY2]
MNAALFDEFGEPELDAYPPLPATDPRLAEFFRTHNVVPPVMLGRCIGRSVWSKTGADPQTCTGAYRTLIGVRAEPCTESPRGGTVWILRLRDDDGTEHDSPRYTSSNHVAVLR